LGRKAVAGWGEAQTMKKPSGRRQTMNHGFTSREKAALERLIQIAQAATGQGRMTATFLLSWWNAPSFGGFDLTTLWSVDPEIAADMVTIFSWVSKCRHFPDDLGYDEQFRRIVRTWRPATTTQAHS
jgi:hypothetical protein